MPIIESRRDELKNSFLNDFFKNKQFQIFELPADASFRTYSRIVYGNVNYILMDAPPIHCNLRPFIRIAEFLSDNGFSAPQIYHIDIKNGFLLLEDFGSTTIAKHLLSLNNTDSMNQVYRLIIDLLTKLQSISIHSDLETYTNELLTEDLRLYTDWYLPKVTGSILSSSKKEEYFSIWYDIINELPKLNPTIVLRDYHVENLMLLKRDGINSIGLLDFQDAVIGNPVYDLVSVLEDARFDIKTDFAYKCLDYYLEVNPHLNRDDVYLSYHILGAQRNSRILGVFARKALRDGQEQYLRYIPLVLKYLENDLSHKSLKHLKLWIKNIL